MGSICTTAFVVRFTTGTDPSVDLVSVSVGQRPGFDQIYYWAVVFTYVTGHPPATAFRLTSADGLTGTFFPPEPKRGDDPREIRTAQCEGTVAVVTTGQDVTFTGTIAII